MHIPFTALLFSLDFLHAGTPSANSSPSTNSSHTTQGRYQPFMYLLLCYSGCFIIILFSGCYSIQALQVLTVLLVPTQATQHKDDTNPSCISFCAIQGALSFFFYFVYHDFFLFLFIYLLLLLLFIYLFHKVALSITLFSSYKFIV